MNFQKFNLDLEKAEEPEIKSPTSIGSSKKQVPGIERTDIGAFLSEQWKETEENNRMGESRYLLKKIGDTKGTFHSKMGSIKDRNGMDLTEAEDIKKRWQEYTEQ